MEIRTARFLLRDFGATDEPAYIAQHTDTRGAAFRSPEEMTDAHARRIFSMFLEWAKESPRRNYQLAVCPIHDADLLIGTGGIRTRGCEPGVAELGIALGWEYHGRYRYAMEVIESLLSFGFHTLELAEVRGVTAANNTAINRLVQRYGFTETPPRKEEGGVLHVEWRLPRDRWSQWAAGEHRG